MAKADDLFKQAEQDRLNLNLEAALKGFEQARKLYVKSGKMSEQANCWHRLGIVSAHLDNLDAARAAYDAALSLYKAVQDRRGEANTLQSLGDLERRLGNVAEARSAYDAALPLFKAVQDRLGEANTLKSLGDLEHRLDDLEEARSAYDAALSLYKAEQNRLGEANTLRSLGDLERRLGNLEGARGAYDAALPLYKAEQDRLGEANTLKSLGDLEQRLRNFDEARNSFDRALGLYQAIQSNREASWVLDSIAEIEQAVADARAGREVAVESGLSERIGKAIEAISREGHKSARARITQADWDSQGYRLWGGFALGAAVLMLFAPLLFWSNDHDGFIASFQKLAYAAWLLFAFPVLGLSSIGISLLRHDVKIMEDRRAYSQQIDVIERLCGVLLAGKEIEDSSDAALERVKQLFDLVARRLIAEGVSADAAEKVLGGSEDESADKLVEKLLPKILEGFAKAQKTS